MSKTDLLNKAAALKKKIDSGRLKGKQLKQAKSTMYSLRYRANKKAKNHPSPKAAKKKVIHKAAQQGKDTIESMVEGIRLKIEESIRVRLCDVLAEELKSIDLRVSGADQKK
jgi:hypothetical protein